MAGQSLAEVRNEEEGQTMTLMGWHEGDLSGDQRKQPWWELHTSAHALKQHRTIYTSL